MHYAQACINIAWGLHLCSVHHCANSSQYHEHVQQVLPQWAVWEELESENGRHNEGKDAATQRADQRHEQAEGRKAHGATQRQQREEQSNCAALERQLRVSLVGG